MTIIPAAIPPGSLSAAASLLARAETLFNDIRHIQEGRFDATIMGRYHRSQLSGDELALVEQALISCKMRQIGTLLTTEGRVHGLSVSIEMQHKPMSSTNTAGDCADV